MSPPTPDYNLPDPPTLLQAGTLKGQPINIDPSSIRPAGDGNPLFLASLTRNPTQEARRDGEAGVVAVKVVELDGTRRPRDGRKEAELLGRMQHPNILALLNAYLTPTSLSPRLTLFTPYYPFTLRRLLTSSSFLPSTPGFTTLSISWAYQLISAVAYLHDQAIAHRDINPNNVVLARSGRLVLIDFGIAIHDGDEKPGEMCFEVGTGPYRAPELVFASRTYSPPAIDLWALAATLCEFFTPLETPSPPSPPSSEDSMEREWRLREEQEEGPRLSRKNLFRGGQSDFALIASIFRVLGTPNVAEWPEAACLPSFHRFTFASFPPASLASHLTHLEALGSSPLPDILQGMLVHSAAKRMDAKTALAMLDKAGEVSLPPGLREPESPRVADGDGESLEEILARMLLP
ncbi:hypothetical protein JCM11641_001230 [Rhodosporidiobolus odoratus]